MRSVLLAAALRKPPLTFTPAPGSVGGHGNTHFSITITASEPVVWNWSSAGDLPGCNVGNGDTALSITFDTYGSRFTNSDCQISLDVGANHWDIDISAGTAP